MAFWNEYPNRKDWRKPSRKCSTACMPHGSCGWCLANRFYQQMKEEKRIQELYEEWKENCFHCSSFESTGWCCRCYLTKDGKPRMSPGVHTHEYD